MYSYQDFQSFYPKLEFLLSCKVQDFQMQGYQDINETLLWEYFVETKWKNKSLYLNNMVQDILTINYHELMDQLKLKTIFHAKEESLHQIFSNLV